MNKACIISLTIVFFFSCSEKETRIHCGGFKELTINLTGLSKNYDLTDTIGKVSLMIPNRLDTFYKWHRKTDFIQGGWIQYRFGDSRYKQFSESGFYWTYVPDSTYQLTIRHNVLKMIPDSVKSLPLNIRDTTNWYWMPRDFSYSNTVTFLKKEFKIINNRSFLIISFITPDRRLTDSTTLYLVALTRLKDRDFEFVAECGANDTTGFLASMHKSLLSLQIEEKQ